MRVRVVINGPQFWQCEVTDIETGRKLPVLIDGMSLHIQDGQWVLSGSILVDEVTGDVLSALVPKSIGDRS